MQIVEEIYQKHIANLTISEKRNLVERVSNDLRVEEPDKPKRSLLEFEGLGKEIWEGIDAQEYVNELRNEWDHRP